ncbi:MAG: FHA domain-containing protein [Bdellovibrionales bacterium]
MNLPAPQNQSSPTFRLVIESGPDKGGKFKLLGSQVTIGRSRTCDIRLKDPKVSRVHAIIEFTPEGIFILEHSKSNRMIVNGVATKRGLIRAGSKIKIANNTMIFMVDDPDAKSLQQNEGAVPGLYDASVYGQPSKSSKTRPRTGINPARIVIVGLVILFLFLQLGEDNVKNKRRCRAVNAS